MEIRRKDKAALPLKYLEADKPLYRQCDSSLLKTAAVQKKSCRIPC